VYLGYGVDIRAMKGQITFAIMMIFGYPFLTNNSIERKGR
jgi:hypothetical protein